MLMNLEEIKFRRRLVPEECNLEIQPSLITFNDGNIDSYGVVAYALWTLKNGKNVLSLIMSTGKIIPIL